MDHDNPYDPSTTRWRCVQFQYVDLDVVEMTGVHAYSSLVVDLLTYPTAIFNCSTAVGLYIIRYRRHKLGLSRAEFRAWDVSVIFNIAANLFLVIMP